MSLTIKLNYMVRHLLLQFVNIADGNIIKLQYVYVNETISSALDKNHCKKSIKEINNTHNELS